MNQVFAVSRLNPHDFFSRHEMDQNEKSAFFRFYQEIQMEFSEWPFELRILMACVRLIENRSLSEHDLPNLKVANGRKLDAESLRVLKLFFSKNIYEIPKNTLEDLTEDQLVELIRFAIQGEAVPSR